MASRVGTWWIRDGLDARREEARGFGQILGALVSTFSWSEDHGDSNVLKRDFVETEHHLEKVDLVDSMFLCTHGTYDLKKPSTYGRAFLTHDGTVRTNDDIHWGKWDLEHFCTHACRLLYHSSTNSVGRWVSAFERLHYMFGFHTPSQSGSAQRKRGMRFGLYAALHFYSWRLFPGRSFRPYTLRAAWKKANVEVEGAWVQWAYLRADGKTPEGQKVDTYNEKLWYAELDDPVKERTFYRLKGTC